MDRSETRSSRTRAGFSSFRSPVYESMCTGIVVVALPAYKSPLPKKNVPSYERTIRIAVPPVFPLESRGHFPITPGRGNSSISVAVPLTDTFAAFPPSLLTKRDSLWTFVQVLLPITDLIVAILQNRKSISTGMKPLAPCF